MVSIEEKHDVAVRILTTGKEILDYIASISDIEYDVSETEISPEKTIDVLQEYMVYPSPLHVPYLTTLMFVSIMIRLDKQDRLSWTEQLKQPIVQEVMQQLEIFVQNNEEQLDKWIKFHKSLYRKYRLSKGEAAPITETIPLSAPEIGSTVTNFLNYRENTLSVLCSLTVEADECLYEFDDSFDMDISKLEDMYGNSEFNNINIWGYREISPRYTYPNKVVDYRQLEVIDPDPDACSIYMYKNVQGEDYLINQDVGNKIGNLLGLCAPKSQIVVDKNRACLLAEEIRYTIGTIEPIAYFSDEPVNSLDDMVDLYASIDITDLTDLMKALVFDYLISNENRIARRHRVTKLNDTGEVCYKVIIENDFMSSDREYLSALSGPHESYVDNMLYKIESFGYLPVVKKFINNIDMVKVEQCIADHAHLKNKDESIQKVKEQYLKLKSAI